MKRTLQTIAILAFAAQTGVAYALRPPKVGSETYKKVFGETKTYEEKLFARDYDKAPEEVKSLLYGNAKKYGDETARGIDIDGKVAAAFSRHDDPDFAQGLTNRGTLTQVHMRDAGQERVLEVEVKAQRGARIDVDPTDWMRGGTSTRGHNMYSVGPESDTLPGSSIKTGYRSNDAIPVVNFDQEYVIHPPIPAGGVVDRAHLYRINTRNEFGVTKVDSVDTRVTVHHTYNTRHFDDDSRTLSTLDGQLIRETPTSEFREIRVSSFRNESDVDRWGKFILPSDVKGSIIDFHFIGSETGGKKYLSVVTSEGRALTFELRQSEERALTFVRADAMEEANALSRSFGRIDMSLYKAKLRPLKGRVTVESTGPKGIQVDDAEKAAAAAAK